MASIDAVGAREILDSRGNPTVEVEVALPGSGAAYRIDGWTGNLRPHSGVRQQDGRTLLTLTLAPGETAYAGVLLSAADGSGDGGATAHKLTVAFQGYTPNSDGGPSAIPGLPADGVYYDSSMAVTYWQQSRADALTY